MFLASLCVVTNLGAHVVKKGETLTDIAYNNISTRVYGKNGSLRKILALNPKIKNINFIRPGQVIILSDNQPLVHSGAKTKSDISAGSQSPYDNKDSPLLNRGSILELSPFYNITTLSARDSTTGSESTIASDYYFGVNAQYGREWNQDFQTTINLKLASIDFELPATSTKSLKGTNKFLSSLGLEANQRIKEKTRLKLGVSYGQELFIRAFSTQGVEIDALNIPSINSKISHDVRDFSRFTFGISASYSAKMPGKTDSYEVEFGHEYGASIYLKKPFGNSQNSNIQTELGFSQRNQNTNLTSQTETNIIFMGRFLFSGGSGI